jgi:pimeloyl-ACP methyl ester carboxylesterase
MVVVRRGAVSVDVDRFGAGPPVLLVSGVSREVAWVELTEALRDDYRVLTVDVHGQGNTPPWTGPRRQTLSDQVKLLHAITAGSTEPLALVGHSFGADVVLRAAVELGARVAAVVAIEPTAFAVLPRAGRHAEYAQVAAERIRLGERLAAGEIEDAINGSTSFWVGERLARLPTHQRDVIERGMHHRLAEWDAVTDPVLTIDDLATSTAPTLVAHDPGTLPPVRAVAEVLAEARPDWERAELPGAGHLAPLSRPDLVNALVEDFLERHVQR